MPPKVRQRKGTGPARPTSEISATIDQLTSPDLVERGKQARKQKTFMMPEHHEERWSHMTKNDQALSESDSPLQHRLEKEGYRNPGELGATEGSNRQFRERFWGKEKAAQIEADIPKTRSTSIAERRAGVQPAKLWEGNKIAPQWTAKETPKRGRTIKLGKGGRAMGIAGLALAGSMVARDALAASPGQRMKKAYEGAKDLAGDFAKETAKTAAMTAVPVVGPAMAGLYQGYQTVKSLPEVGKYLGGQIKDAASAGGAYYDAYKQRKSSEAAYGTVEAATATRNKKKGKMGTK